MRAEFKFILSKVKLECVQDDNHVDRLVEAIGIG